MAVGYCDYITNQFYEQQEEYEKIAQQMIEEGLDPSCPDAFDKFVENYDDYLRSLHEDLELV